MAATAAVVVLAGQNTQSPLPTPTLYWPRGQAVREKRAYGRMCQCHAHASGMHGNAGHDSTHQGTSRRPRRCNRLGTGRPWRRRSWWWRWSIQPGTLYRARSRPRPCRCQPGKLHVRAWRAGAGKGSGERDREKGAGKGSGKRDISLGRGGSRCGQAGRPYPRTEHQRNRLGRGTAPPSCCRAMSCCCHCRTPCTGPGRSLPCTYPHHTLHVGHTRHFK